MLEVVPPEAEVAWLDPLVGGGPGGGDPNMSCDWGPPVCSIWPRIDCSSVVRSALAVVLSPAAAEAAVVLVAVLEAAVAAVPLALPDWRFVRSDCTSDRSFVVALSYPAPEVAVLPEGGGGGPGCDASDRAVVSDDEVDADALALWACARIAWICCQRVSPPDIADVDMVASLGITIDEGKYTQTIHES